MRSGDHYTSRKSVVPKPKVELALYNKENCEISVEYFIKNLEGEKPTLYLNNVNQKMPFWT